MFLLLMLRHAQHDKSCFILLRAKDAARVILSSRNQKLQGMRRIFTGVSKDDKHYPTFFNTK